MRTQNQRTLKYTYTKNRDQTLKNAYTETDAKTVHRKFTLKMSTQKIHAKLSVSH